jgi:hypothetical protein
LKAIEMRNAALPAESTPISASLGGNEVPVEVKLPKGFEELKLLGEIRPKRIS